ncbi:hypothetical protein [Chryseobacterium sp. SIMBA_029]|uniref:hypothetical protein n=1 Tax=Chryseobacterium sp. SIMBA_029 TaxID=3085772 RepID=UPI00397D59DF
MPTEASHKLIPMTTFVIEYYSHEGYADLQTLALMNNYANFLKKPLTLGMFVPVDPKGNVLKMPKNYTIWKTLEHNNGTDDEGVGSDEHRMYQKAEQKCFFEEFRIDYNGYSVVRIVANYDDSIELTFNKSDLRSPTFKDIESFTVFEEIYLTHAALKAIGIKK